MIEFNLDRCDLKIQLNEFISTCFVGLYANFNRRCNVDWLSVISKNCDANCIASDHFNFLLGMGFFDCEYF